MFELEAGGGKLYAGALSDDERTFACSRWVAPTIQMLDGDKWVTFQAKDSEEAGAIVFAFDVETGQRRFRMRIGEDHGDCATALALSPDGAQLAIATESGGLQVIEVSNGRQLLDDPAEPAQRVQFSPDGQALYVSRAGEVTTYEASGGGEVARPESPKWFVEAQNGEVVLRSMRTGEDIAYLEGAADNTTAHPKLPLWAASTGPELRIFALENDPEQEIEATQTTMEASTSEGSHVSATTNSAAEPGGTHSANREADEVLDRARDAGARRDWGAADELITKAVWMYRAAANEHGVGECAALARELGRQWALNVRHYFHGGADAREWAREQLSDYRDPATQAIELGAQRIRASDDIQNCVNRLAAEVTLHFVDLDDRERLSRASRWSKHFMRPRSSG